MRWHRLERFLIVIVHLELRDLLLVVGRHSRGHHTLFIRQPSHHGASIGVVGKALGQNVTGSIQGGCCIGNIFIGINEGKGRFLSSSCRQLLGCDDVGQRLQSPFPGNRRLGAPLRFVRQIQVFHLSFLARVFDPFPQLRGQLPLLIDGFEYRDLALLQFTEVGELFLNRTDLHLVKLTGMLLAVAGDKGDRGPLLQQFGSMFHLKRLEAGRFDDIGD